MKKYLRYLLVGLLLATAACSTNNPSSTGGNSSSNSTGTIVSTSTSSSTTSVENIGETMSIIDEIIRSYVPSVVDKDITLPTSIEGYNITISWASQNENVISSTGKYTKPINDTTVILTATYEYKGTGVHKVEITPTVYGYTAEEKMEIIKGNISKPEIDYNHSNVTLVTEDSDYGVTISWTVSGSEFVAIEENILSVSEDAFLEGTSFTLVATYSCNDKETYQEFTYTIDVNHEAVVNKVASLLAKPELVNNSTLTIPLTGEYNTTISWSANDSDVVFEENTVTIPALPEEWTLVLYATIDSNGTTKTVSFDYQVAADDEAVVSLVATIIEDLPIYGNATLEDKADIDEAKAKFDALTDAQKVIWNELAGAEELEEKLSGLLSKYIELTNVVSTSEKATWDAVEVATSYEVTLLDLDKTFEVTTNEFVYADYGIPTDSQYNVSIKVLTGEVEYITYGTTTFVFGTDSELPKVATPVVTLNGTESFAWDASSFEGATSVRVYCDGVLRREVDISEGSYSYRYNGIADDTLANTKTFAIQFVGNGTTHQTSDFYVFEAETSGAGFALDTPSVYVSGGNLSWAHTNYNQGFEVRIDDFRSYYTPYKTKLEGTITVSLADLNLPVGTHTLKVKTLSDNGGTPSSYSNEITVEVVASEMAAPEVLTYSNDSLTVSWSEIPNAIHYNVEIPQLNYKTTTSSTSLDLGKLDVENGDYEVKVSAFVVETSGSNVTINHTLEKSLEFSVVISESKLSVPTNVSTDYYGVYWDAVEGATSYEVVLNETDSYVVTSNSFVFADNNVSSSFEYSVKVRALSENVADYSFYSEAVSYKLNVTNVALSSLGATASATNTTKANEAEAIDGNDGTRWESDFVDDVALTITLDKEYTIYGLYISWEGANAAKYNVEVSTDGENWTTVYEFSTTPVLAARVDNLYLSTPVQATYVRIQGIQRGTPYGYSIWTLEVYSAS